MPLAASSSTTQSCVPLDAAPPTTSPFIARHRPWILLYLAGIFALYNVADGSEDLLITSTITNAMSIDPYDVPVSALLGGWRASVSGFLQLVACTVYERTESLLSPPQHLRWLRRIALFVAVVGSGFCGVAMVVQNDPRYRDDPIKFLNQPFLSKDAQTTMFWAYWLNNWTSDCIAGFLNPCYAVTK